MVFRSDLTAGMLIIRGGEPYLRLARDQLLLPVGDRRLNCAAVSALVRLLREKKRKCETKAGIKKV